MTKRRALGLTCFSCKKEQITSSLFSGFITCGYDSFYSGLSIFFKKGKTSKNWHGKDGGLTEVNQDMMNTTICLIKWNHPICLGGKARNSLDTVPVPWYLVQKYTEISSYTRHYLYMFKQLSCNSSFKRIIKNELNFLEIEFYPVHFYFYSVLTLVRCWNSCVTIPR